MGTLTLDQLRTSALELPTEERWDLAQEIWQSLAAANPVHDLPDELREILDQRIAEDDSDPEGGSSWPEAKQRILSSL